MRKMRKQMTDSSNRLIARTVLDDCRAAYHELKKTSDRVEYRRRWFAFIALLGAVGEVANDVDKNRLRQFREAFDRNWRGEEPIVSEFIEAIRNQTVHAYRSGLFERRDDLGNFETSALSDFGTAMSYRLAATRINSDDAPIPYLFKSGHYKGCNVYDICEQALDYLETYLSNVERDIDGN